jgi:hypothetical protein
MLFATCCEKWRNEEDQKMRKFKRNNDITDIEGMLIAVISLSLAHLFRLIQEKYDARFLLEKIS